MTRRLLFCAAALLAVCNAFAQQVAVYDSRLVLPLMPQHKQAQEQLQATSARLQQEYTQMQAEFDTKYADYQLLATDPATPATIRERRIQEIQQADKALQDFQQRAAADSAAERQRLMEPVDKALADAVATVARQAGYSLVLDVATTPVAFRGDNTPDITEQVKAQIGL